MGQLKRELIGEDALAYQCEDCGAPIDAPPLCSDCQREFDRIWSEQQTEANHAD